MHEEFEIDVYESYIDGNKLKVLLFSLLSFVQFYFTKRNYDIYHIHAASYGSTFRKGWYVRAAKKWGKKVILHIHGAEYMIFYDKSNKKKKICSILKAADTEKAFPGMKKIEKFLREQKPELLHYQKFLENGTAERAKESGTEQNYNMIDACVNNNPKKPRIIGNRISVLDRLHIKLEERKQKSQPQQQQQQERSRKN